MLDYSARRRTEINRIFHSAYYDEIDSLGEVVALESSTLLDIYRADVLLDAKRHYVHPRLRADELPVYESQTGSGGIVIRYCGY